MVKKGLLSLLPPFSLGGGHHHHRRRRRHHHDQPQSLSATMADETIANAEELITKWDPNTSGYAKVTSMFHHDRAEAHRFLVAVHDLQSAMLSLLSAAGDGQHGASHHGAATLVRAQALMQAAMRCLEKELYLILAANRALLDPESVSASHSSRAVPDESSHAAGGNSPEEADEMEAAGAAIDEVERAAAVAMDDLRDIAQIMISVGYSKECVRTYKIYRKSIVDEGLYRLGFEHLSPSQVQKLDWNAVELKVSPWLRASRTAVRTLFHGERVLLDHVFEGSDAVREVIFAEVAGSAAAHFFQFPESVAKTKMSSEKIRRLLDMYGAISELSPEIDIIFPFQSTGVVRAQVASSLSKLADAARAALQAFESALQKDSSNSPVLGGGVHLLTRYAMDYIASLADYETTLADVFVDFPFQTPSTILEFFDDTSPAPAQQPRSSSGCTSPTSSSSSHRSSQSSIAERLAWLILVLLCKIDNKANAYRDVRASYLFLANNMQYIVNKVRACRLGSLLGEEWVAQHEAKARKHASGYERAAWDKVAAAVTAGEVTAGEARERARAFNASLEEACAAHDRGGWVVADAGMRDEVRAAVVGMVVPAYQWFYERWRAELGGMLRYSPEDVHGRVAELLADGSDSEMPRSIKSVSWDRPS